MKKDKLEELEEMLEDFEEEELYFEDGTGDPDVDVAFYNKVIVKLDRTGTPVLMFYYIGPNTDEKVISPQLVASIPIPVLLELKEEVDTILDDFAEYVEKIGMIIGDSESDDDLEN